MVDGTVGGEKLLEVLVRLAYLQHLDALAGEEREVVVVVESNRIVGNLDSTIEPPSAVDGEAQGGFGNALARDVEGGQRSLATIDEKLDG